MAAAFQFQHECPFSKYGGLGGIAGARRAIGLGSSPSWLAAKNLFKDDRQVAKRLFTVALETGSVHDGKFGGLQGCQLLEESVGVWRVGRVIG